ncbi:hypothetical protein OG599_30880 [Streptomyces sp. NBC_01335]|uniref:hypothetical protein n=1 Tax=Streptomyces sp. NBC_01335 TaxID=2903828 RepID=UPI002E0ED4EB|nr:hypothetical protein OG599_30880 [Streptomyces sp. NBC_01335]
MSTADQEQVREQVRVEDEDADQGRTETPDRNETPDRPETPDRNETQDGVREDDTEGAPPVGTAPDATAAEEEASQQVASDEEVGAEATGERRLTPRQARRLRIALSSVGMAVMAVVLWMRIASRSSVLVVGVYGLALILCGVVMELSRNGRTRLASWLLGIGLLAAVGTDWLLLP